MAAQYANPTDLDAHIADMLNAAATWGGAIVPKIRSAEAITNARREAAYEVLQSISRNSKHGYFPALAVYVDVPEAATKIDDQQGPLPAHDGEIGVPLIVPFFGAGARTGVPAKAEQIDTWLSEKAGTPSSTGARDGNQVLHNESDPQGRLAPTSCRYSVEAGLFKFTGYGCRVPMMIITEDMADNKVPLGVSPAVVKLAIPKLMKPGDNLYLIGPSLANEGRLDLIGIEKGALAVKPVRSLPEIVQAQKAGQ